MTKKISCELFKTRAAEKHGSIYDYSKIDFIKNAQSKVKIICGVHGEFEQIVKVHLKGHGCQKCGGRFVDSVRFYKKVKEIHKDRYDYSESVFTGQDNHIDIICRVHGKFTQLASNHLKGSGCRECSKSIMGAKKHTQSDFIEKAKLAHGDRYAYELSVYTGATGQIKVVCKLHGEFKQKAHSHLQGNGCPYCKGAIRTTERFVEKAKCVHGERFSYEKTHYKNSVSKITVTCPEHGDFSVAASEHLRGSGCQGCMVSHPEIVWLNSLGISNRQKPIRLPNKKLVYVDGFDETTNTIYEFYGDFWHGNPAVYDQETVHPIRKITFGELYENTLRRESDLRSLGYNVVSIWEKDYFKCLSSSL